MYAHHLLSSISIRFLISSFILTLQTLLIEIKMNFENMNGGRRGRMVALQEYILQGSILDSSCEMLLHRLRGLCDNGDSPTETFEDKEYVYSISKLLT